MHPALRKGHLFTKKHSPISFLAFEPDRFICCQVSPLSVVRFLASDHYRQMETDCLKNRNARTTIKYCRDLKPVRPTGWLNRAIRMSADYTFLSSF